VNLEHYEGQLHVTADPKFAFRWEFLKGWTFKGSGGMAHQPPPGFQTSPPFGDPNLPPVEAVQSSVGLEWSLDGQWFASIEGFYNHLSNIAGPVDGVLFEEESESLTRRFFSPNTEGRAYGLEVMLRKQMGGIFHGWISYTLSRAERLFPGKSWQLYQLDQTHILNLAATVRLPMEWSIGARFQLSTGNPYYPVVGSTYNADSDRYEPIYSDRVDRMNIYHRLDLRVDKRFRFDTWMLDVFLDIQNVYNASNPENIRYSYDFGQSADGVSIPILPTLGVRAMF